MNRLGNRLFSTVFAVVATSSLAACGGGQHSSMLPQPAPLSSTAPTYTGPLVTATLTVTIPVPSKSGASARRASYISASTRSIKIVLNSPPAGFVQPGSTDVTPGAGNCPGAGPWTCTIPVSLPPGSDNITVSAYDGTGGTGNLLSQQTKTFPSVAVGQANTLSIILDANTFQFIITPPGSGVSLSGTGCPGSTISGSGDKSATCTMTINGGSAVNSTIVIQDHGSNVIPLGAPGDPTLSSSSSNTGNFTTSTSGRTLTITPVGSSGTAVITLNAVPPGCSPPTPCPDGLAPTSIKFTVATVPTIIAISGCSGSNCEVDNFTFSGGTFTSYGKIPTAALNGLLASAIGFDNANTLYVDDDNVNKVQEYAFSSLSATSGQTPTRTIVSGLATNANTGQPYQPMTVAPNGVVTLPGTNASANQFQEFNAAATSVSLGKSFASFTSGCPSGGSGSPNCYWRAFSSAVLTSAVGTPFGYAVALGSDNGLAANNFGASATGPTKIAILDTGGTETDLTTGNYAGTVSAITSGFDPPTMIWDPVDQALVVADNNTGDVWQYAWNGSSFGPPTSLATGLGHIGNGTGPAIQFAVSRDGHLAEADSDFTNSHIRVFTTARTLVANWNPKNFPQGGSGFVISSIYFMPNNDVLFTGGPPPSNFVYVYSLASGSVAGSTQLSSLGILTGSVVSN